VSESVPETTQVPTARLPVVVIAPWSATTTPQDDDVVTKLTVPLPVVTSWVVNADEAVVVVVPVADDVRVTVTAVIVRV
jgi:hypothetical protein